jgi:hypothetical protein
MNKPGILVYRADVPIGPSGSDAYKEAGKFLTRLDRYEGTIQRELFEKVGYVVVTATVYAESGISREFQIAVTNGLMKSYTVANPDPEWTQAKPEHRVFPGKKEQTDAETR